MTTLLQIDFPYPGPWGDEMTAAMRGLAQSIAQETGLLWKIWTENAERQEAGGIYLFTDPASAQAYLTKHTQRLQGFGVTGIQAKVFEVNAALSQLDRAPV